MFKIEIDCKKVLKDLEGIDKGLQDLSYDEIARRTRNIAWAALVEHNQGYPVYTALRLRSNITYVSDETGFEVHAQGLSVEGFDYTQVAEGGRESIHTSARPMKFKNQLGNWVQTYDVGPFEEGTQFVTRAWEYVDENFPKEVEKKIEKIIEKND